jgi:hypothetical protein
MSTIDVVTVSGTHDVTAKKMCEDDNNKNITQPNMHNISSKCVIAV